MSAVTRALALALLVGASACASSPDPTTQPTAQVCASDPRVTAFKVGVEATASTGAMKVAIETADPTHVVQGVNTWTLRITDPQGAPLDGLTVAVKPVMPDHGHGSSTIPQITALGGGRYRASAISLPMRGVWNVAIVVTGAVNDSATFTFCVDGA